MSAPLHFFPFRGDRDPPVKTLEIHVSEGSASKIEQAAVHKSVSLDELIRISFEEKLARDDQFDRAARHVLTKNAELYERLS
jgi:hypothetical protein